MFETLEVLFFRAHASSVERLIVLILITISMLYLTLVRAVT